MKSVLISTRPKWCEKICHEIGKEEAGKPIYEKRIEVRKTAPKEVPFKAYIYETKGATEMPWVDEDGHFIYKGRGQVIGEFVCDKIEEFHEYELSPSKKFYEFEKARLDLFLKESCLSYNEVCDYRKNLPYYKPLYGWHITDLKIYDKPEELSKFFTPMGKRPSYMIERPPQSYMYVEEV